MASDTANSTLRPGRPAPWRDPRVRGIFLQIVFVAVLAAIVAFLVHNTVVNLRQRGIAGGFGFLGGEASFGIGESLIEYSPADTYSRAFLVGLTNTQLLFWWGLLRGAAPAPRQAWQPLPDVFVSNRGIVFPVPHEHPAHLWMLGALVAAIAATWAISRWANERQARTGQQFPSGWLGLGLVVGLPLVVFLAAGMPLQLDVPALRGFNFSGGVAFSPEFAALLIGLVIYTGSFIAEIVRAGILAVSWGQSEAALALGLTAWQRMRLIVLPQALRVIVPPMTSEYLSLTKNSSLAVIIGYPDLVSIANTTINQTGHAVEGITMIMAVYLAISLAISLVMNLYNRAVALVER